MLTTAPASPTPGQADIDADGSGDACDPRDDRGAPEIGGGAPTKSVSKPPSRLVSVPVRSGFRIPPGVAAKPACGTKVRLRLRRGKATLARRTVALRRDGRTCRFRADFKIARTKIGSAKTLTCVGSYRGTRVLGGRTWSVRVRPAA